MHLKKIFFPLKTDSLARQDIPIVRHFRDLFFVWRVGYGRYRFVEGRVYVHQVINLVFKNLDNISCEFRVKLLLDTDDSAICGHLTFRYFQCANRLNVRILFYPLFFLNGC